jgi:hypothetical protein
VEYDVSHSGLAVSGKDLILYNVDDVALMESLPIDLYFGLILGIPLVVSILHEGASLNVV